MAYTFNTRPVRPAIERAGLAFRDAGRTAPAPRTSAVEGSAPDHTGKRLQDLYRAVRPMLDRLDRVEPELASVLPEGWRQAVVSVALFAILDFSSSFAAVSRRHGPARDGDRHDRCREAICARLRFETGLPYRAIGQLIDRTAETARGLARRGKVFVRPAHALEFKGA